MKPNHKTLLTMGVFAAIFILIGTFAPVIYASYMPASEIIEVHRFEPTDTTVDSEFHNICWERDSGDTRAASIRTELILLSNNGEREISRTVRDDILEEGQKTITVRANLPENIEAGTYQYNAIIQVQLAEGRVTRTFRFVSEKFHVYENKSQLQQANQTVC
jgi:hypothetical protein